MIKKRVSSVFVRAASGEVGIVTERDILRAMDAGGETALSMPVSSVMQVPLQTVPEHAFVYRAIGRMDRLGFRHLGVTDDTGGIVGALTTRNLLRHRATTAVVLGDKIDSASDPCRTCGGMGQFADDGAHSHAGGCRPAYHLGGGQRRNLQHDTPRRRARRGATAHRRGGSTTDCLRGPGIGFGGSQREPARSRPGQRDRLRGGRRGRIGGYLFRETRHAHERHPRRRRHSVLQRRRHGQEQVMAQERGGMACDHRRLGATAAARRSPKRRHLLRRGAGSRRGIAGRGSLEPRLRSRTLCPRLPKPSHRGHTQPQQPVHAAWEIQARQQGAARP